ncbi:MAG: sugar phosphate isomerase/epimerase [Clostridia bacterium]|nr:sugar phosphate isomerase/epimerase [Clostridia bacterium]
MRTMQNYEIKTSRIRADFLAYKAAHPELLENRLRFSWSNWGFGLETLETSAKRLRDAGIPYIELHGNHHGPDLGYRAADVNAILGEYGIAVSGICGIYSPDNDLSSNRPIQRQAAIDYIRREVEFTASVGGKYVLVCPGAVGRTVKYDDSEWDRSLDSLARVADEFVKYGIRCAIEPIRSAETTVVNRVAEAHAYIDALNHPGVAHINGDVFHMLTEEAHIGEAILACGDRLTNLHLADTTRGALGTGSLDLDTVIMALYLMGYNNRESTWVTPEPLGAGADPYPMQNAHVDPAILDKMVFSSYAYFREREEAVLAE